MELLGTYTALWHLLCISKLSCRTLFWFTTLATVSKPLPQTHERHLSNPVILFAPGLPSRTCSFPVGHPRKNWHHVCASEKERWQAAISGRNHWDGLSKHGEFLLKRKKERKEQGVSLRERQPVFLSPSFLFKKQRHFLCMLHYSSKQVRWPQQGFGFQSFSRLECNRYLCAFTQIVVAHPRRPLCAQVWGSSCLQVRTLA